MASAVCRSAAKLSLESLIIRSSDLGRQSGGLSTSLFTQVEVTKTITSPSERPPSTWVMLAMLTGVVLVLPVAGSSRSAVPLSRVTWKLSSGVRCAASEAQNCATPAAVRKNAPKNNKSQAGQTLFMTPLPGESPLGVRTLAARLLVSHVPLVPRRAAVLGRPDPGPRRGLRGSRKTWSPVAYS